MCAAFRAAGRLRPIDVTHNAVTYHPGPLVHFSVGTGNNFATKVLVCNSLHSLPSLHWLTLELDLKDLHPEDRNVLDVHKLIQKVLLDGFEPVLDPRALLRQETHIRLKRDDAAQGHVWVVQASAGTLLAMPDVKDTDLWRAQFHAANKKPRVNAQTAARFAVSLAEGNWPFGIPNYDPPQPLTGRMMQTRVRHEMLLQQRQRFGQLLAVHMAVKARSHDPWTPEDTEFCYEAFWRLRMQSWRRAEEAYPWDSDDDLPRLVAEHRLFMWMEDFRVHADMRRAINECEVMHRAETPALGDPDAPPKRCTVSARHAVLHP